MPNYITLITTRITIPDQIALLIAVKAVTDSSAVLFNLQNGNWRGKKGTIWTPQQIIDTQIALDTTPALTPQLEAQRIIDSMSIFNKAIILLLLDEINILRTALSLPVRTPSQAITGIRNKAGTL